MTYTPEPGSPPPPFDGIDPSDSVRWSAVLIGMAVDWIATVGTSLAVYAIAGMIAVSRGGSETDAEAYIEQLHGSPEFMLIFSLIGLLCISLGGFVAARRAGYAEVRHSALVGVGSILVAFAMEGLAPADAAGEVWSPAWLQVLGYLLAIPFAVLGGIFAERTRSDSTLA